MIKLSKLLGELHIRKISTKGFHRLDVDDIESLRKEYEEEGLFEEVYDDGVYYVFTSRIESMDEFDYHVLLRVDGYLYQRDKPVDTYLIWAEFGDTTVPSLIRRGIYVRDFLQDMASKIKELDIDSPSLPNQIYLSIARDVLFD